MMDIITEIFYSPLNLGLLVLIGFLVYKIIRDRIEVPAANSVNPPEPELPKMRRDFTIQELRKFDGNQPDGRVLVAVNGNVFDVTKGKRFYGPGGPYATFAGRDASRNLATFSVVANDKDEYDDLSDLGAMEMDSVREWEMQFKEKYELVGKLLRKGETPTNYEDEEDDAGVDNTKSAAEEHGLRKRNTASTDAAARSTATTTSAATQSETNEFSGVDGKTSTAEEVK